jgi:hypothetical protein
MDYYYHNPDTKVLIIGEREMSQTMKALLDLSYLDGKIYFLSLGKGFDKKTIKKSSMRNCKEIFFINDPHSNNCDDNDKKTLFLKMFLVNNGINSDFYLQLSLQNETHILSLENDIHQKYIEHKEKQALDDSLSYASIMSEQDDPIPANMLDPSRIDVISFRKFMFSIFAKNTFCEGFIPFITCFMTDNDTNPAKFQTDDLYDKL